MEHSLKSTTRRGGRTAAPTAFITALTALKADWPVVPVLILAAALRMSSPALTEFKYDEARLSALALDWVAGGALPLAGMGSSIGLSNDAAAAPGPYTVRTGLYTYPDIANLPVTDPGGDDVEWAIGE